MITLLAVPLLIGAALGLIADRLARTLRPRWAVPLLTVLALSVALCTGLVLSVAAVLVGMQVGPLPHLGHWSVPALRSAMGFPDAVGALAMPLVVLGLGSALVRAVYTGRTLIRASRAARRLQPPGAALVVLDDAEPVAYSVTGSPGRIVVSTAMLAALSADECRVLFAHEASHLRHRHQLYLNLTRLAAAANPLLRPVTGAVSRAVERAADEDAASDVGDRPLAARALARAALARAGHRAQPAVLGAVEGRVVERVQSLLAPPVGYRQLPVVLVLLAVLASWAAAAVFAAWGDGVVEVAEAVYLRR